MSMRLLVITPHFEPDTAPTGIIITSLVEQWVKQGHQIEVVTSLPWYETVSYTHLTLPTTPYV